MGFAERAPSAGWAALTYKGEALAEAWLKPDGDPLALRFRVPRELSERPGTFRRLTLDALVRAVAVDPTEVQSWRFGDGPRSAADGDEPGLKTPLPAFPPDAAYLLIHVRLKPPAPPAAPAGPDLPAELWADLDALWKTILGLEAGILSARMSADATRAELETAAARSPTMEEKTHALQSDVAQWTKAKGRIHFVVPKLREFVTRATWATTLPERKRLEDLVRDHIEPRVSFPDADRVREEMEHLVKARQVLSAQGTAVCQEGRGIAAEIQRALGTLQRNAADRARAKRNSKGR